MTEAAAHWPTSLSTSARLLALATILGAFPFLFILDQRVDASLSPVLPGVAVLAVLGIMIPFILTEWWQIRLRKKEREEADLWALRRRSWSRILLTAASLWVVVWLAWGI